MSSMPRSFQWLTVVNPVRHYIEIVRDVFLKGTGVAAMWPKFVALWRPSGSGSSGSRPSGSGGRRRGDARTAPG